MPRVINQKPDCLYASDSHVLRVEYPSLNMEGGSFDFDGEPTVFLEDGRAIVYTPIEFDRLRERLRGRNIEDVRMLIRFNSAGVSIRPIPGIRKVDNNNQGNS